MSMKANKTLWLKAAFVGLMSVVLLAPPAVAGTEQAHTTESKPLCPPGPDVADESDSSHADREAIEALMAQWSAAVYEADLQVIASLVTYDAEFWTHGAALLFGRQALVDAFEPFLDQYQMLQRFDCQELIISDGWAFMRGMEINHLTPRDGGETVVRKQRAFSVVRREANGKWLFARGMTNLPPDE